MDTMYDTLLQLPLFQGLVRDDFTSILEKVKLSFAKYKAGEMIIESGATCNSLVFVLKGEISVSMSIPSASHSITEFFQAPYLIEPQSLLGMRTNYVGTYVAQTATHTVSVSKYAVLNVLFTYEIFRLNFMNILSNKVQTLTNRLWNVSTSDLKERIVLFFLSYMERPEGKKIFKIKMQDLAYIMNETRITVSKVLNEMQENHLLELHRGEIVIPAADKMLAL